ncbi:sulfurtransferase TusA family protein [Streptomyces sp. NPDC058751]|uniref:sulfurtransferase TusA family protein n=1 Tax=Streptomyces sp. NPDC058751 TaxID=3346623 RepID=UPI0036A419CD
MNPANPATPSPCLTVDGTGLLRVTLLLRLREEIDGARPGTVVHVITTDPAAPLRPAADTPPTRADAPWHPATGPGTAPVSPRAEAVPNTPDVRLAGLRLGS